VLGLPSKERFQLSDHDAVKNGVSGLRGDLESSALDCVPVEANKAADARSGVSSVRIYGFGEG